MTVQKMIYIDMNIIILVMSIVQMEQMKVIIFAMI